MTRQELAREWHDLPELREYRRAARQLARDVMKTDPRKGIAMLRRIRDAEDRALSHYCETKLKTHEQSPEVH